MEQFITDLQNMDARLTELEEKIDDINTKLTQVVDAILGNPLTKTGGFMHDIEIMKDKIDKLEKEQDKQKSFRNRVYWTLGIGVAILMIAQYITSIISNVSK